MISLDYIKSFFPPGIREVAAFQKYMLKEYIQLLILDFLSATPYARKIVFIGGTSLRLVKGIDRFSEELDFDIKDFTKEEFLEMTDAVLSFLKRYGFNAESRDRENRKLSAFRRSIYFPELLFELGLSGHKEERFLLKIVSEDQVFQYTPAYTNIKGCGFYFPFPVPPDPVLCSMKISAMLLRSKGRDFYDVMFLMSQSVPDYEFLAQKHQIHHIGELKERVAEVLDTIDLKNKKRDFEHLLFSRENSDRILSFGEFMASFQRN